jgi:hypothetical protein
MWITFPITLNEYTVIYTCGICGAAVESAFLGIHKEWHDKTK